MFGFSNNFLVCNIPSKRFCFHVLRGNHKMATTLIREIFLELWEGGTRVCSNDYKVGKKKKGFLSRVTLEKGILTCNDFQVKLLGQCLDKTISFGYLLPKYNTESWKKKNRNKKKTLISNSTSSIIIRILSISLGMIITFHRYI